MKLPNHSDHVSMQKFFQDSTSLVHLPSFKHPPTLTFQALLNDLTPMGNLIHPTTTSSKELFLRLADKQKEKRGLVHSEPSFESQIRDAKERLCWELHRNEEVS